MSVLLIPINAIKEWSFLGWNCFKTTEVDATDTQVCRCITSLSNKIVFSCANVRNFCVTECSTGVVVPENRPV